MPSATLTFAAETAPKAPQLASARPAELTMQSIAPAQWDGAVAAFDEVCQEQLSSFASSRWPGVVQEPVLFYRGEELVGGCLVMVQPLPLRLGAIAVTKWAPMLRDTEHPDAAAIYRGMIDALTAEYAERCGMMLSVLPRASLGADNSDYAHLLSRGFRKGARLLFPNRYLVNLQLTDAEHLQSFEQKWRYHLKRSERADLSFEVAGPEQFDAFNALYEQMVDRKRFPDHSAFDTVRELMMLENPLLRPELFFVRHSGEIVAGAIIFKAGDRAVYLYGATSAEALELRAGYFLHWKIIGWLRDNTAACWYDLGGTDGFQGLHQFKKGMVGARGLIRPVPPVANYAARLWPRLVGETAFAGRELLHRVNRWIDRLRPDRAKPDQHRRP
ncbi:lipid II:glycine glycyltransferase FemX [Devosia sp.]|uniref:lipid II:glycine glycyltransferase FemX n=1 Tax=Devosia sp. TaxID=1871048 RepID=UPI003BAB1DFA